MGWGEDAVSPMHAASYFGRIKAMEILFDRGAFIEHPKKINEITPLMHAAQNSEREAVEWLLSKGANPVAVDKEGGNALHWLLNGEIIDEEYEKNYSLPTAKALLKAGVPLDAKNKNSQTPLDLAKEYGLDSLTAFFSEQSLRDSLKDKIKQKRKTDKKFDEKKVSKM